MNRLVAAVIAVLVIGLSMAGVFLLSSTPPSPSNGSTQTTTSTTPAQTAGTRQNLVSLTLYLSDYGFNAS
ncbi:MAG: hypothetical protein QXD32_02135, partial [Nitrososphaerota archaeon]